MVPSSQWFENDGIAVFHRRGTERRKHEVVPRNVTGFPTQGPARVFREGETIDETSVLVVASPVTVRLQFDDVHDVDGIIGTLFIGLEIDPPISPTAVALLREFWLQSQELLQRDAVADRLSDFIKLDVSRLALGRSWEGEDGVLSTLRSTRLVTARLEEPLFDMGLALSRVLFVEVESNQLDLVRSRQVELRQEAARVKQRLDFIELWKREELGEALARAEVQRVSAHLRRQGAIRDRKDHLEDLEEQCRLQADEARERGRLRRMLERERLETQAAVDQARLNQEIDRARELLATLGEADATPARLDVADIVQDEGIEELSQEIGVANEVSRGSDVDRIRQLGCEDEDVGAPGGAISVPARAESIGRIWIVAGLTLYRLEGGELQRHTRAIPVLPDRDLGYLRSVSVDPKSGLVVVGGQLGVGRYDMAQSRWHTDFYPTRALSRNGANSVVCNSGGPIASHSGFGLGRWRPGGGGYEGLHQNIVVPGRSTRGLQSGPDERLYFAHAATVMSLDPDAVQVEPRIHGSFESNITAIGCTDTSVIVGTRSGELYKLVDGHRWHQLEFVSNGPIFSITFSRGWDEERWVVGARRPAVHLIDGHGSVLREYRSRYPIRWVDCGREAVLGVDRLGLNLIVWRWGRSDDPAVRIRVPDQIQSIAIEHVQIGGAVQ